MGKETKLRKDRKCKTCKSTIYTTAQGIIDHERYCKIAARTGLIIPGLIIPKG